MRAALLALAASPAASSALAEGARQTYDCRATQICDGAGACAPTDEAVTFTLDPVELGRHGEGTFTIRYAGVEAEAVAAFLPFDVSWAEGRDDLQRLLLGGESADGQGLLLWHASRLVAGTSTLRFLTCDVTQ